jgi:hypothetical protein
MGSVDETAALRQSLKGAEKRRMKSHLGSLLHKSIGLVQSGHVGHSDRSRRQAFQANRTSMPGPAIDCRAEDHRTLNHVK